MSSGIRGMVKLAEKAGWILADRLNRAHEQHYVLYDPSDPSLGGELDTVGGMVVQNETEKLRAHFGLPIIYKAEWSDYWTMFNLTYRWFDKIGSEFKYINYRSYEIAYAELPSDCSNLVLSALKLGHACQNDEERWSLARFTEALRAYNGVCGPSWLFSYRIVHGGSVDDASIAQSRNNGWDCW